MSLRHPVFLGLCLVFAGCYQSRLQRVDGEDPARLDDKLAIEGRVCTSDPEGLEFPVKVVFVVDSSQSMEVSDPLDPATQATGRRRAVEAAVDRVLGADPTGVGIAIIGFAGPATILTGCDTDGDGIVDDDLCFTSNRGVLAEATEQLDRSGGTTAYLSGLGMAFTLLSADMRRSDELSLSRSRYAVVFLSDGLPDSDLAEERTTIVDAVEDIVELGRAHGVGELAFHTAFLSTAASPEIAVAAEDLLRAMASAGGGTFRSFPGGQSINFLAVDLTSLRRAFTLSTIVAVDTNALLDGATVQADSDGDTLADVVEDADGDGFVGPTETDPLARDSDGHGFSDGLERALGLDPTPSDPAPEDCVLDVDRMDTDGDGLLDCEERFQGTSRLSFDSDRDGLPDPVEIRYGTNPADDDAEDDADFDQTPNGHEIRTFGDPRTNDAATRADRSYRIRITDNGLDGARSCLGFRIENVTLVETLDDGWNLLYVYAGQVPFDDPGSAVDYRAACIWARFDGDSGTKDPPGGFVVLGEDDFHPVACGPDAPAGCVPLDPEHDCAGPGRFDARR